MQCPKCGHVRTGMHCGWCGHIFDHYTAETYSTARKIWLEVHQEQIKKGAAKYPEPLTHSSWTMEQLIIHAMQENIDQFHYLTAMLMKERKRNEIESKASAENIEGSKKIESTGITG